jgi:hypothetical protein
MRRKRFHYLPPMGLQVFVWCGPMRRRGLRWVCAWENVTCPDCLAKGRPCKP